MTIDLDALEALAKAATPGPWVMTTQGGIEPHDYAGLGEDSNSVAQVRHDRNWEFIAAADPSTVVALIAELRQERERADANEGRWDDAEATSSDWHSEFERVQTALSRAEGTIEKVRRWDAEQDHPGPLGNRLVNILVRHDKQQKEDERG